MTTDTKSLPEGKREQNKAANRQAILDAATEIFTGIGYDAATVRDIIRQTDLAAGTFYNYFPDKESVFLALLNTTLTEINEKIQADRVGVTTLEMFIEITFRVTFELVANDPASIALLRRNAGTIRSMLNQSVFGANVADGIEHVQAAVAAGILPPIDADLLVNSMSGISFELSIRMADEDPPDIERYTKFATALVVGGIERLSKSAD